MDTARVNGHIVASGDASLVDKINREGWLMRRSCVSAEREDERQRRYTKTLTILM